MDDYTIQTGSDPSWTWTTGKTNNRIGALAAARRLCEAGRIQPAEVTKYAKEFAEFLTSDE